MQSFSRSLLVFLAATAAPQALAQTAPLPSPTPSPPAAQAPPLAEDTADKQAPATDEAKSQPEDDLDEDVEEEDDGQEIVVTGQRLPGRVIGDIPPEITLNRREVRALGASNIAELLDALAPQTRSGRGRGDGGGPVVLLGGRRISGFREIRDLPPEAIDRVEILPEEVALKYGFRADQRVVNIVLRRRFRATTVELEGGLPTAGGRNSMEADVNILRLDRAGRWSLDAEYRRDTALFESERDILQEAGRPDEGDFRTLLPATERLELGGTLNRTLPGDISTTLNATFDAADTVGRFGLPTFGLDPLTRDGSTRNGRIGISMNGDLRPWRWSFTGNLDRNRSTSFTDVDDATRTRDRGRAVDFSLGGQLVANGPLFTLPAGAATTSIRLGASSRDFSSDSLRSGIVRGTDLSRDRGDVQANIDAPIASRRDDFLSALGDLSVNGNIEIERLSDFGTLTTWGGGVNWSPIEQVRIIASYTDEEGAPSVQQLGDPVLEQANARVFDFTRGETVDVTRIDGGNPVLVADNRRVTKFGVTVQPIKDKDLTLTANYTANRTRDVIASFPAATAQIEAAFPDRFSRGADGRLFRIDSRPVNFARAQREELRSGINFSRPIGKPDPARQDLRALRQQRRAGGAPAAGAPGSASGAQGAPPSRPDGAGPRRGGQGGGGRGPGGGGGGFGRGLGGGGRGNLQIGLYHTWRFEDSILIREGVAELDLLNGSAIGNRGGRARHEVEFQSGIFKNGLGARLTGTWQSGTTVRGSAAGAANGVRGLAADGADDLRFGSFSTVNLRLFADLGAQQKLVRDHPFLRGARVSLIIDNLFDTRLTVRDADGVTPIGFQRDLLDPVGRSVRVSLRKVFFPTRRRR